MALKMANMVKTLKGTTQQQLGQIRGITTLGEGTHMQRSLREQLFPKGKPVGDYVPVYVALGMISLSVTLGLLTAKQQLMHAPDVRVKKSRRETLPEVVEPEHVAHESEEFIKKSLFRKVAHIQEFKAPVSDPIHANPLAKEPRVESLKAIGVEPVLNSGLHR